MTVIERDFNTKHHTYLSNNICYLLLKVLSHIDSILQSPRAPPSIFRPSKGSVQNYIKENGQGCGFEHLPLTIEMWADQLVALKVTLFLDLPFICSPLLHPTLCVVVGAFVCSFYYCLTWC